jgi:hypothetical protein
MKTLGRIFILSSVFVFLAALMIVIVNKSGMNAPDFGHERPGHTEFHQTNGNGEGGLPFHPEGEQSSLRNNRWVLDVVKNIGVIAILVAVIVWPKRILRKRRR